MQQSVFVAQVVSPGGRHVGARRQTFETQVVPAQQSALSAHSAPSAWQTQRPPVQSIAPQHSSAVAQVAPFVARLEATVAELGSITAGADSVDARLTETQRCITALQESHRELDALP